MMHKVFHIGELVDHICSVTEPSALACLARTSSHFHPPSLRGLYMITDTGMFGHLLDVFYGDSIEISSPRSHWERFELYVKHISRLDLLSPAQRQVKVAFDESFTNSLARAVQQCFVPPLLPNLRTLNVMAARLDQLAALDLLSIGGLASLRNLNMGWECPRTSPEWAEQLAFILTQLPHRSPNLVNLIFSPSTRSHVCIPESFRCAIEGLLHLKECTFIEAQCSTAVIEELGQCPQLTALHLMTRRHPFSFTPTSFPGPQFQVLRKLLLATLLPTAISILTVVTSTQLHRLRIATVVGNSSTSSRSNWMEDVRSLARQCSRFSFTHFEFETSVGHRDRTKDPTTNPDPSLVLNALLSALHNSWNMIKFSYCCRYPHSSSVTDEHIALMAGAWPRLRHLDLRWHSPKDNISPAQCTTQGLMHLSRSCRDLQTLTMWSLFVPPPAPNFTPPWVSRNRMPLHIVVLHAAIEDEDYLACFLAMAYSDIKLTATRESLGRTHQACQAINSKITAIHRYARMVESSLREASQLQLRSSI